MGDSGDITNSKNDVVKKSKAELKLEKSKENEESIDDVDAELDNNDVGDESELDYELDVDSQDDNNDVEDKPELEVMVINDELMRLTTAPTKGDRKAERELKREVKAIRKQKKLQRKLDIKKAKADFKLSIKKDKREERTRARNDRPKFWVIRSLCFTIIKTSLVCVILVGGFVGGVKLYENQLLEGDSDDAIALAERIERIQIETARMKETELAKAEGREPNYEGLDIPLSSKQLAARKKEEDKRLAIKKKEKAESDAKIKEKVELAQAELDAKKKAEKEKKSKEKEIKAKEVVKKAEEPKKEVKEKEPKKQKTTKDNKKAEKNTTVTTRPGARPPSKSLREARETLKKVRQNPTIPTKKVENNNNKTVQIQNLDGQVELMVDPNNL